MIKLRIGGVPEHFNLPWHLALEARRVRGRSASRSRGATIPTAPGAMAQALRDGELDAALLLTEGAVAGVAGGGPARDREPVHRLAAVWGIHVPAASRFRTVGGPRGARYAISRMGSGSHLMAFVHARAQGWPVEQLELVTVGNLDGAVEAFAAGNADVFFWEKLMTKPLVDEGKFRRIGEFTAPWPAFVVCAARALDRDGRVALGRVVALVLDEAQRLARAARRGAVDRASVRRFAPATSPSGSGPYAGARALALPRVTSARHARYSARSASCRASSLQPNASRRCFRRVDGAGTHSGASAMLPAFRRGESGG